MKRTLTPQGERAKQNADELFKIPFFIELKGIYVASTRSRS